MAKAIELAHVVIADLLKWGLTAEASGLLQGLLCQYWLRTPAQLAKGTSREMSLYRLAKVDWSRWLSQLTTCVKQLGPKTSLLSAVAIAAQWTWEQHRQHLVQARLAACHAKKVRLINPLEFQ